MTNPVQDLKQLALSLEALTLIVKALPKELVCEDMSLGIDVDGDVNLEWHEGTMLTASLSGGPDGYAFAAIFPSGKTTHKGWDRDSGELLTPFVEFVADALRKVLDMPEKKTPTSEETEDEDAQEE